MCVSNIALPESCPDLTAVVGVALELAGQAQVPQVVDPNPAVIGRHQNLVKKKKKKQKINVKKIKKCSKKRRRNSLNCTKKKHLACLLYPDHKRL